MPVPPDLESLLPDPSARAARRDALIAEITPVPSASTATGGRGAARAGVALALAAIVVVVATGVLGTGGGGFDVVAKARAAVSATQGVLHVRVRYVHGPYASMAYISDGLRGPVLGRATGSSERWSTTQPLSSRTVDFVQPAHGGRPLTMQTEYAGGVLRMHNSWRSDFTVQRFDRRGRRLYERRQQPVRPAIEGLSVSLDPVGAVRRLLISGTLRNAGHRTADGRSVIRLTGQTDAHVDGGGTPIPKTVYEYLVDAATYEPVQITTTRVLAARPGDPEPAARHERRIVDRWVFETFERLPLDEHTRSLLRLDTTGLHVDGSVSSPQP